MLHSARVTNLSTLPVTLLDANSASATRYAVIVRESSDQRIEPAW